MPTLPPVTVNYPEFASRLANAIVYPDSVSYPAISTVQVQTPFDSDNLTNVPSVSTTYIYPKTALLVSDVNYGRINGSPFGDNAAVDAFGRLRVGLPQTLLDSKMLYDKLPQLYDEVVSGSATSTFVPGDSLVAMQTAASGDYAIRQTYSRFNYQPGKSMLAALTFVAEPQTNVIKRIGLFQGASAAPYTPTDGLYLEITSTGATFNITKTAGTSGTTTVPQSAWNIDPLNGAGSSGLSIGQIFALDYEWLGLGRVRFGFYLEGKLYYAHEVTNLNILSVPYLTSPNQPVRYEIRQTGAGSGTLKQICASVANEGSPEEIGLATTASTSATITTQSNTMTPILAIRGRPSTANLALLLKDFSVYNTTNNVDTRFVLYRNPTISGGSLSFIQADNNNMDYALGSTTLSVSGGYELASGFVLRSQGTAVSTATESLAGILGRFGTSINGTPETLVLAAAGIGGGAALYASMNALIKS